MTDYEKYLCASAEFEVSQLKESGQKFVLDKEVFDPMFIDNSIYEIALSSSGSISSMEFKNRFGIRTGFGVIELMNITCTALEMFLSILWRNDEFEKVYKIVEKFATWKNDSVVDDDDNLFTL